MRIVFMGTPEFAVPSLKALVNGNQEVCAVVTQPDRPKGRKRSLTPPPIKLVALKRKLRLLQVQNINDLKFIRTLRELAPEIIVVVAFGQLLSRDILDLPEHGCINLHPSLLPKYRGASPIESAILSGEAETGVTTFYMTPQLDAGDIILQQRLPISPDDTAGTLRDKLAQVGTQVLTRTLSLIASGEVLSVPQDESEALYTSKLKNNDGLIDWSQTAHKIHDLVRGMNPWPGAYTILQKPVTSLSRAQSRDNQKPEKGNILKIWKTEVIPVSPPLAGARGPSQDLSARYPERREGSARQPVASQPGQIVEITKEEIVVACGEGRIKILEVQPADRRIMTTGGYLRGHRVTKGMIFGTGKDAWRK